MGKNPLCFGLLAALVLLAGCQSDPRKKYSSAHIPPLQPDYSSTTDNAFAAAWETHVPTESDDAQDATSDVASPEVTVDDAAAQLPISQLEAELMTPLFKEEKINELIRSYDDFIKKALNAIETKDAQKTKEMETEIVRLMQEGQGLADKLDEAERKAFYDYITKRALQVKAAAKKQ